MLEWGCACVGQHANLSCCCGSKCECVESACGRVANFILLLLFLCTCVCGSALACCGSYFEIIDILGGHFEMFDSQRHFPSYSSLLSVLALGPTVYRCLDLGPETGRLQHV